MVRARLDVAAIGVLSEHNRTAAPCDECIMLPMNPRNREDDQGRIPIWAGEKGLPKTKHFWPALHVHSESNS